jgi:hypothetical protein
MSFKEMGSAGPNHRIVWVINMDFCPLAHDAAREPAFILSLGLLLLPSNKASLSIKSAVGARKHLQ